MVYKCLTLSVLIYEQKHLKYPFLRAMTWYTSIMFEQVQATGVGSLSSLQNKSTHSRRQWERDVSLHCTRAVEASTHLCLFMFVLQYAIIAFSALHLQFSFMSFFLFANKILEQIS